MPTTTLEHAIEENHQALGAFPAGDPEPLKALYSRREDVTLANPFGPPARGWSDVASTMERAAEHYRGGRATGFDHVSLIETDELACLVEIERYEARILDASEVAPIALRVTTVFRREGGEWLIAHRHADTTVTPRPPQVLLGR